MVTTNCETSTAGCCFPIEAGLTGLVQTRPTFYCVYSICRFYSDCDIKRSVNVDHHSRCPNHPPSWGGSLPPDRTRNWKLKQTFCSPKQDKLQVKLEIDSQALIYKAPQDKSIKSFYIKYFQVARHITMYFETAPNNLAYEYGSDVGCQWIIGSSNIHWNKALA